MSKEGISINSIKEISATFPGFRFSPTDAELISYYLKRKIDGADLSRDVITEVEICKFEPWDLPAQSIIHSDHEWFFFSPNDKKYPNGSQAKRATRVGFWKATGKERGIKSEKNVIIGTKRTLVFHIGRSPKGTRTDWIMHEYCLKENKDDKSQDSYVICRLRKNQNFTTTSSSGEAGNQPSLSPEDSTLHATPIVCNDLQHIQIGVCREGKDDTVRSIEDDWFADIMKDDIVNLDYGQFYEAPLLPNIAECAVQESSPAVCPSESGVRHIQGAAPRDIRPGRDGDRRNVKNMPRVGDKDEHPEVEVVKGHGNGNCVLIYLAKSKNSLLMANGWRLSTIFVVLAVVVYFFVPVW